MNKMLKEKNKARVNLCIQKKERHHHRKNEGEKVKKKEGKRERNQIKQLLKKQKTSNYNRLVGSDE